MKKLIILPLLWLCALCISANNIVNTEFLKDKQITLATATDYHITSAENPLVNSTINIQNPDARLFFDNMRPATVLSTYASCISINGEALSNKVNAQVLIYKQGAVVVPHASDYKALTAYTSDNYQGQSLKLGVGEYNALDSFDNNIRSFVLKRGYMATLANENTGLGYSRVFIADDADIEMPVAPGVFYGKISYIRVFRWNYASKKGWCTTASDYDWQAGQTESTWFYTWSADKSTTLNCDYTVIKQHLYWPSWTSIYEKANVCNLMGYNEPEHSEQHESADCSCGGTISADKAVAQWPEFMKSGMRLGSPCPTDMSWLYDFVAKIDAKGYRLDYVAIHAYWGGLTAAEWYSQLKTIYETTKRPIWITEWNNGANWTTETWPTDGDAARQKQLTDIKAILNVLDTASFVERYSIYNWVGEYRRMIWDSGYPTPAGFYYKNDHPTFGYAKKRTYVPTYSISTPTLAISNDTVNNTVIFSITDNNGELTDKYTIQHKTSKLYNGYTAPTTRAYDNGTTTISYTYPADSVPVGTFRIKLEYCNGSSIYSNEVSRIGAYTTNDIDDGDYYILNAENDAFLTNTGSTPTFTTYSEGSNTQLWTLAYDTAVARYKITSKADAKFMNENATLSSGTYYNTWNTYNLHHAAGSDCYAIQNGGKSGEKYWSISTTITGKGTTDMAGFPFRIITTDQVSTLPQYTQNTLANGFYHIVSSEDSTLLTNNGTTTPTFGKATGAINQIWQIVMDTTINRYKIMSCADGRFMNEFGNFASYSYDPIYHTFNLYRQDATSNYSIKNEGSTNLYYWKINGTSITGKGTAMLTGCPFILESAVPQLTIFPQIQIGTNAAQTTDSVTVTSGSNIILSANVTIPGGTFTWSSGENTSTKTLTALQASESHTLTYVVNEQTVSVRFSISVYNSNQLVNGDYFIKNIADGTFLTLGNRELGPEFMGRNIYDRNTQLWNITKDGTTGRYKIINKKDNTVILNEYALYTSTYYPAWNSFNLYNIAGTNQYALQNAGSSGTAYWRILDNVILGKGSSSFGDFPFLITTFDQEETPDFDALTYIQINSDVAQLTDSIVTAAGNTVSLIFQSTTPNTQFAWSNGETTESIKFENLQESKHLNVQCTYGSQSLNHTFHAMVYMPEVIEEGQYFILNEADGKYLTNMGLAACTFQAKRSDEQIATQLWYITTESNGRHKITSVSDNKFFASTGRIQADDYNAASDSYSLFNLQSTNRYAIQNAEDAGTDFWQISSNKISVATNTEPSFCFVLAKYEEMGIDRTTLNNLQIISNPVTNQFIFNSPAQTKMELFSVDGKQIGKWTCEAGMNYIQCEKMASGTYLAKFTYNTATRIIKFVKQ